MRFVHYSGSEYSGEVAIYNRNIVLQGGNSSLNTLFGGHIIIRPNTTSLVSGVELTRMGQQGYLGRYPIHWHKGNNYTYGNAVLQDSSIHHTFQRCLSIHDSNNTIVKNNVAFFIYGHCYFLEDATEMNNTFSGNLGALILDITGTQQIIPSDDHASVFWISNPSNYFINNVASGGRFGYWFVMPFNPTNQVPSSTGGLFIPTNDPLMFPRQLPLLSFTGNKGHSNREIGLMIDDMEDINGLPDINLTQYTPLAPIGYSKFFF